MTILHEEMLDFTSVFCKREQRIKKVNEIAPSMVSVPLQESFTAAFLKVWLRGQTKIDKMNEIN